MPDAPPSPRAQRAVALLVAVALAAGALLVTIRRAEPATAANHPSFVFVLTDDLDLREFRFMPHIRPLLQQEGTTFSRYFASVSLCCPSRATTLRGQYAHNTGVETNGGTNGGFETAYQHGIERSTIAVWLQRAGYRTALIGKYLNGYPLSLPETYVPPGWNDWVSAVAGDPYGEFDYTLNDNGRLVNHGHRARDYGETVYTNHAVSFIRRSAADDQPFFLYFAGYPPHQPATPAPRDAKLFPNVHAPRTASYDEVDVRDKPQWIRQLPMFTPDIQLRIDNHYRRRLQSLQSVDRAVVRLVEVLKETHRLDSTYFVFTSDNGFHLGQHRMPYGKQTAYEEDIHLPMVIRGPGVPKGKVEHGLVGNVDLAPTFAALAGASTPAFVDGRSFAWMLGKGHGRPPRAWRHSFLLEHFKERPKVPTGGRAPLEPPDVGAPPNGIWEPTVPGQVLTAALTDITPNLEGFRTTDYAYVHYDTGEQELYDLRVDPAELVNLASVAPPALLARLQHRATQLARCRADDCRRIEALPVPTLPTGLSGAG